MTTIDPKALAEQAQELAKEPPTPGLWVYIFDAHSSLDSKDAHLLVSVDESFQASNGEAIKPDTKMQCIAHFHRPADARRVIACIKAFEGMPTDVIEALPESVDTMLMRVIKGQLAAKELTEKASDEHAWAELRTSILGFLDQPKPTTH